MTSPTRRDNHRRAATQAALATADWPALGTTAQVVVTDPAELPVARAAVEEVLAAVDVAASRFRDDSELSHLNSAAGRWVPVSPLFARTLRAALDAAEQTDGLVDPTIGAALLALGYDRTFTQVAADGPQLTLRREPAPGWRCLELDESRLRARVAAGTTVDLGATAKGLAADLCATAAADAGRTGVLVALGGDIAVAGPTPGVGWPVAVTDLSDLSLPADSGLTQVIALSGAGLATSSTRARRWRRGGSVLHHLIDPATCAPAVTPWRTVSVIAETCLAANTASTAAIIIGDEAPAWLDERWLSARLVRHDDTCTYVGSWPTPQVRS